MTERESASTPEAYSELQSRVNLLEKRLERLELREMGSPRSVVCFRTIEEYVQAEHLLGYLNRDAHYHVHSITLNYADAELLVEAGIQMYIPPKAGIELTSNDLDQPIDGNVLIQELKEFHRRRFERR